jgi:hypothetical protein
MIFSQPLHIAVIDWIQILIEVTELASHELYFLYSFWSLHGMDTYFLNKITSFEAIQSHGSHNRVIKYFRMRKTEQHDKPFALQ